MAWYGWGIATILTSNALLIAFLVARSWWERHMDRAHSRSFDRSFLAEHKIDFSHTARPTFLGGRR